MPRRFAAVCLVALTAACSERTASPEASPASVPAAVAPSSTPLPTAPTPTSSLAPLGTFDSPAGIAASIAAAEHGIRDPTLTPDEVAGLGRLQQRAYRALANRSEWDAEVRSMLSDDVHTAFDLNVEARRAVVDHAATRPPADPPVAPPTELPAWAIVAPEPADVLLGYYREAEASTGVPWAYLAAIHLVETRMGRVVGESSAGAVGPMQFLPSTWAACCVGDPLDTREAIRGAAEYLVLRGAPADMRGALYGYNPNNGYVGAVDAYARNLLADERAYRGYHAWEVYVTTSAGTVRLPVGYVATEPIDAAAYLAAHPEDRAPVSD